MTFVERLAQIRRGPRPTPTRNVTPFIHVDFETPAVRKLLDLTARTKRPARARTAIFDLPPAAPSPVASLEEHSAARRLSAIRGEDEGSRVEPAPTRRSR